jgi:hypothetical protein
MGIVGRSCHILAFFLWLGLSLMSVQTAHAETQTFNLEIRARKVVGTTRTIRVTQGETAILRWTTDETIALHLHGYDIEQVVKPGALAELTFKAHATGRFPITVHDPGGHGQKGEHGETPLLYLEVLPR